MDEKVLEASRILEQGGVIIFPTDTAFGIGCRIDSEDSIKRLFSLRKRPETQATPVLVDTVKMAQGYLEPIPQDVIQKLIEPFWPGALTIVLKSKIDKVPELVRGSTTTLGVRIPNHTIARALISEVGVPILGPSANFHGEKTPYSFEELDQELVKLVDYVVPGECSLKQVSTVVDCTKTPWKVIRSGAVILNLVQDLDSNEMPKQVRHDKKRKEIILLIDTSSNEEIRVGLEMGKKKDEITEKVGRDKKQVVLPLVQKLLDKHQLKLQDINSIQVNVGPGSFTGLRIGVSIANALSFALDIPVNGKKQIVEPVYE